MAAVLVAALLLVLATTALVAAAPVDPEPAVTAIATPRGGPLGSNGVTLAGSLAIGGRSLTISGADTADPAVAREQQVRDQASSALTAGAALVRQEPDDPRPPVIARYGGLELRLPGAKVMAAGFHEAATANGLPMEPVGTPLRNLNATKFELPDDAPSPGTAYLIMSSRGRSTPATSALDVLMPRDEPVLSPVSGVVADVREILVEQRHRDLRIELRPDDAPELRVVVVHLDGVRVAAGDRVESGLTVLADTSRQFPFLSQIDNLTYPELYPHLHLEVQPRDAPRPGGTPAQIDPPPVASETETADEAGEG